MAVVISSSYDSESDLVFHELAKGDRGSALKRAKNINKRNPAAGFYALEAVKAAALKEGDKRKAQKAADGQRDAVNRMKKNRR